VGTLGPTVLTTAFGFASAMTGNEKLQRKTGRTKPEGN
jgi:hypothetical protein